MTNEAIVVGLSVAAVVLSGVAIVLGSIAIAICVGLKNSTHKIQYVPLEDPFINDTKAEAAGLFPDTEELLSDEDLSGGDWSNAPSRLRSKK